MSTIGTALTTWKWFPYRPAANLQFWRADVAFIFNKDWRAMDTHEYVVYTPPLPIEVFSPSNRPGKINRQRIAAFSGGAREFWAVDPVHRTVEVSEAGKPARVYSGPQHVSVTTLQGIPVPAHKIFGA